ncbi:hypothetical protein DFA_00074 [Cavenderia fasciculata]|uniref:Uncharacterized protein n=1 Tax=Cavenderia fasciculata TaxID=261658 RepID=F4PXI7_CACFS|nr:uncharacterized protein DFA_00074 [Cavenderia fasciculata]EGG19497.1 hypothetical protein DFA_00074 [Cavenderia fasciculata]|eukprot:XP_004357791.1 hypothetical protein DFA_00074 [Cavenderia fasciculata]
MEITKNNNNNSQSTSNYESTIPQQISTQYPGGGGGGSPLDQSLSPSSQPRERLPTTILGILKECNIGSSPISLGNCKSDTMEKEWLLKCIVVLIDHLLSIGDNYSNNHQEFLPDNMRLPMITVDMYITRIMKYSPCSKECFITILIQVGGVSVDEINRMEIDLLKLLEFDLSAKVELYNEYCKYIELYNSKLQSFLKVATPIDLRLVITDPYILNFGKNLPPTCLSQSLSSFNSINSNTNNQNGNNHLSNHLVPNQVKQQQQKSNSSNNLKNQQPTNQQQQSQQQSQQQYLHQQQQPISSTFRYHPQPNAVA